MTKIESDDSKERFIKDVERVYDLFNENNSMALTYIDVIRIRLNRLERLIKKEIKQ